jgi:G:T-mismatch repair DNA endonuclease (very short patch repair protein)
VIEFNGDYWHANPNIYKDGTIIRGRTAIEIQQRDKKKLQTALDLGFRVLTIWEAEYKVCKLETIEKVIKWMQNGQQ